VVSIRVVFFPLLLLLAAAANAPFRYQSKRLSIQMHR